MTERTTTQKTDRNKTKRGRGPMTSFKTNRLGMLTALATVMALAWATPSMADTVKTVAPGTLPIGFNGDMPMTSFKDGQLIGTDGALLAEIAQHLGLEVKPAQMEWSALIEATKQGTG